MYTPYILAVDRYLKKLAEILAPLQVNMCYNYTLYSLFVFSLAKCLQLILEISTTRSVSYLLADNID